MRVAGNQSATLLITDQMLFLNCLMFVIFAIFFGLQTQCCNQQACYFIPSNRKPCREHQKARAMSHLASLGSTCMLQTNSRLLYGRWVFCVFLSIKEDTFLAYSNRVRRKCIYQDGSVTAFMLIENEWEVSL